MSIVEKLAARIVAEYTEITDPARQLQLRDEIVQAYGFCANPDNAMSTEESEAWSAAHSEEQSG